MTFAPEQNGFKGRSLYARRGEPGDEATSHMHEPLDIYVCLSKDIIPYFYVSIFSSDAVIVLSKECIQLLFSSLKALWTYIDVYRVSLLGATCLYRKWW